ncbi:rna methyltransferase [Cystoisospora suis]|uniref:16S rRNA (uracil(1498)-N(3))-methyltransferase n=1 Tax=Cystoisospora suis TaxID=483139 RepID=A0A2C6JGU5_9APIC|nr:rna methyltransferase [Cystoisospora suis]
MNLILLRRKDVFEQEIGERKEGDEATLSEESRAREEENGGKGKRGEEEDEEKGGEKTKKKTVSYMAYIQEKNARLHCLTVLKVQVGSTLRVGIFNGGICKAQVVKMIYEEAKKEKEKEITKILIELDRDIRSEEPPSALPLIDLLLAIPRPKTLDKILQISASLGVGRLLLVCAERTEKGYLCSPKLSTENIRKQLQTGLEQGVTTRVPEVHVFASWKALMAYLRPLHSPCSFHVKGSEDATSQKGTQIDNIQGTYSLVENVHTNEERERLCCSNGVKEETTHEATSAYADVPEGNWCCYQCPLGRVRRLVAHPSVPQTLPMLKLQEQGRGRILVAIGPEGGWLDSELKELQTEQGFEFFTLGDKVLRCETAVVSVISQVNMLLTDPVLRGGRGPPVVEPLRQTLFGFNDDTRQAEQIQVDSPRSQREVDEMVETSANSLATNLLKPRSQVCSLHGNDEGGASSEEVSSADASSHREDFLERTKDCKGGQRDKSQRRGPREVYCDADKIVIVLPQRYIQARTPAATPPL